MSPAKNKFSSPPEIWGGLECTINRVGDRYKDQLASTGHYFRETDIEQFASLGIRSLRYPLLWEHHQPHQQTIVDWHWADTQLNAIASHNIEPVVGLLHHGSGPGFTDLESNDFPGNFASYALLVAKRFPWLNQYNPINEPLTTARFSGLYGLWYPHAKDSLRFVRMLLNQLRGIVCAMKAIRTVNPDAQLIQTEDLAKTHSTRLLSYQADFENERRWLTFDLLNGKVDKDHSLWNYLLYLGVKEAELSFFNENPCTPDRLGINYYITSERFLDEQLAHYPVSTHGGNGRHAYADTEAVRTVGASGLFSLLKETWQRYRLPIVITEAHLHCTREEQMRWLKEVWDDSCQARGAGIDVQAVTAWALLGAHDWDSLLTRNDLHYEPGTFELRNNQLQLTAVGHLVRSLATDAGLLHPLLEEKGWWHTHPEKNSILSTSRRPLLICATDENLLKTVRDICAVRRINVETIDHTEIKNHTVMDIEQRIDYGEPWGMISLGLPEAAKDIFAAACRHMNIPHMDLSSEESAGNRNMNRQMDLFIDLAISFAMTHTGSLCSV